MVRVLLNVRCSSIITMNNGNTLIENITNKSLSGFFLKQLLNDQKYVNDYIIKKHRVFNASTCIGIELKANIVRNHHDR